MSGEPRCVLCALVDTTREIPPPPPPLAYQLTTVAVSGWVNGFCVAIRLVRSREVLPICSAHLKALQDAMSAHGLEPSIASQLLLSSSKPVERPS
jgi:hypothetical protein